MGFTTKEPRKLSFAFVAVVFLSPIKFEDELLEGVAKVARCLSWSDV